jgi:hypothetical protein
MSWGFGNADDRRFRRRIDAMINRRQPEPLAVLATRLPSDATQVGRFPDDIGRPSTELLLKPIDTAVTAGTVNTAAL